ncbi:MAG: DegT/DnrJ/EryC1/StrS family aminotransferase [Hyphomicrobium sp.]|nr:DegT/DnrJ/EryC1/StrS family aminotransferase [Hyphomicrobium sp.]
MNNITERRVDNGSAERLLSRSDANDFICDREDPIWVGIERAVSNGCGTVFVSDGTGVLLGRVEIDDLRGAIAAGAHLKNATLKQFVKPISTNDQNSVAIPVIDAECRIVGVTLDHKRRFVPVAEPDLAVGELRNLLDAFLSTWISSTGAYITEFEQRFASRMGMAHGIATSNGTVSLQLALASLGIGAGDEVIVPDFTFAGSANAVIHAGARPVLVDVDPDTWCITPEAIRAAITPRTRAVMPVHVFGRAAPMEEISDVAHEHGLFVIEDCAEAHGASYNGRPVGSFSHVSSFSFFANKIITTGEGGICLTNDADLAARLRMLRDHGMRPERRYWHEEPGFNFRMTNIQAAIGCAQLDRLDELLAMRRTVQSIYEAAFDGIDGIELMRKRERPYEDVIWFACARVPASARPHLIEACRKEKIDIRPFFNSLSSMPAYKKYARACPNSRALAREGINLPTSRRVTPALAEEIATIFRVVLKDHTI